MKSARAMKPGDNATPIRIMKAAEVAEYLHVSRGRIYRMARKGKIPAFRIGDDWRFDVDAIEKWMNDRHVKLRKN
jgi:excisionase family DNA binding protein